jgi:outer membrane autotransporter protein
MSGTGSFTKQGAGNLTLTGANSYGGGTTVAAGTLTGNAASLPGDIVNNAELVFDQTSDGRTTGAITGSGNLTKQGGGALTLTDSVAQNDVTVSAGRLDLDAGKTITAAGTFTVASGATLGLMPESAPDIVAGYAVIDPDATLDLRSYSDSGGHLLLQTTGGIAGNFGHLTVGGLPVTVGIDSFLTATLQKTSDGKGLEAIKTLVWNLSADAHGTFNVAGDFTLNADLADNTQAGAGSAFGWDGKSLTKTGNGTLTLHGTNTYTGGTTVSAGTLAGDIPEGGSLTVEAGAVYDGLGGVRNIGELAGTGTIRNTAGLSFGSGTFAGTLDASNTGGLTKTGGGTLTLTGANAFTGMTEVREGKLALSGAGRISDSLALYDGASFDTGGTNVVLNRLDVHGSAAYTGDLHAANAAMNFWIPSAMGNGGTLLDVSGLADIGGALVNVGVDGASSPLHAGDSVRLIAAGAVAGLPANTTATGQGMQGVTLRYTFRLVTTGNELLAVLAPGGGATLNPQTKALSEGALAGSAVANQGIDMAAGPGMSSMLDAAREGRAYTTFALVNGGSSRYKTGSRLDVDSQSALAGIAGRKPLAGADLTLGAFVAAGRGDYDTRNSFANAAGVKGKGDTEYAGLGLLARIDGAGSASGHAYAEAQAQIGRVKTRFNSKDLVDALGRGARYDTRSAYHGAHLGAGYVFKLEENASLDLYGKYLYARRGADALRLNTGDPVRFAAVDSHRLRAGARYTRVSENFRPYAGIAWEREFDAKARATTNGYKIDAPGMKGNTGIVEFGFTLKPKKTLPLTIDLGLQGYAGKRQGVSGEARMEYRF